jgi:hypothetical protein
MKLLDIDRDLVDQTQRSFIVAETVGTERGRDVEARLEIAVHGRISPVRKPMETPTAGFQNLSMAPDLLQEMGQLLKPYP